MINEPSKSLRVKVIESMSPQDFESKVNTFTMMNKVYDIQTNVVQRTDTLMGGTQTVYCATITYDSPY